MWKPNWEETQRHILDWWNREGLLIGMWDAPQTRKVPHEPVAPAALPESIRQQYTDFRSRARRNHYRMAHTDFAADILPVCDTDIGPGSLALYLGCHADFAQGTVWCEPCLHEVDDPEELPPFRFDPSNEWWQLTENTLKACVELGQGKYLTGCPDLLENIDILSALRSPQVLMMDMLEFPEWIEKSIREINQVWFEAYERIYDIIKLEDGSSTFGAFRVWGPGKTAKVQCDASAMFSPEMYRKFVVPALSEQCRWLDNSLYHLDGTQAICHLDAILEIEPLDAVEWTPQAGIENGGHPRWYDLYQKILGAGKSVQVVGVEPDEVIPLLDAVGGRGVYVLANFTSPEQAASIVKQAAQFR